MNVRALPMRRRGRRLKHSDWVNQPAVDGVLSMAELSAKHGRVKMVSITTTGVLFLHFVSGESGDSTEGEHGGEEGYEQFLHFDSSIKIDRIV
jgi:hypothetical protein